MTTYEAKKKQRKPPLPPDPDGINDERAQWANEAVRCFQRTTRLPEEDGLDTAVMDLLADLMHLADRNGLDMKDLWNRALEHYTAETMGEEEN